MYGGTIMRCGSVERKTLETEIFAELNLDGGKDFVRKQRLI